MPLCLKINKKHGEQTRRILIENNLLNKDYKITSEGNYLYLPIKDVDEDILKSILNIEFELVDKELEEKK